MNSICLMNFFRTTDTTDTTDTTIWKPGFMLKDLFSLYVLFSHFRPRDATRGNSFFQMSSYACANVRIINDKNKRKIPMRASRGLKWENKMYKPKGSIAPDATAERARSYFQRIKKLHNLKCSLNNNSCIMPFEV